MTVRHEALTTPRGVMIRRTHNDDRMPRQSIWGGREAGWLPYVFFGASDCPQPKYYSTKAIARKALGRIMAHEKELGIHRRAGRRY